MARPRATPDPRRPAARPRRALRAALLGLALAALAACASAPVFGPARGDGPGWTERRLDDRRLRIGYRGDARLGREAVEDRVLLRAAEATLENGARWFRLLRLDTDPETRFGAAGPGFGVGTGVGRGGVGLGLGYDFSAARGATRWTATADIALLPAPVPGDDAVYAALDVTAALGPTVARP